MLKAQNDGLVRNVQGVRGVLMMLINEINEDETAICEITPQGPLRHRVRAERKGKRYMVRGIIKVW